MATQPGDFPGDTPAEVPTYILSAGNWNCGGSDSGSIRTELMVVRGRLPMIEDHVPPEFVDNKRSPGTNPA